MRSTKEVGWDEADDCQQKTGRKCLAHIHHVGISIVSICGQHFLARSEVALVYGGSRSPPSIDPLATEALQNLLSCRSLVGVRMQHRLDDVVHGVEVVVVDHELRCAGKVLLWA